MHNYCGIHWILHIPSIYYGHTNVYLLGVWGGILYSKLNWIHRRRIKIIIVQGFEQLLSKPFFFEIQYWTNMLNNIWFGSWRTSQDLSQTIFALDPDRWVRIRKDQMMSTIFVSTIGSWRMSQGSANIGQQIRYLWIQSYNLCVYDSAIFVNTLRHWSMSQSSVQIGRQIQSLWIQSHNICEYRRNKCRSI